MYNHYIPQSDGSYRRNPQPEQRRPNPPRPKPEPPKPEPPAPPPPSLPCPPQQPSQGSILTVSYPCFNGAESVDFHRNYRVSQADVR